MGKRLEQAFWTAAMGAISNVAVCSVVNGITSWLKYFSLPIGIVWDEELETLLWRGALVGGVVGLQASRLVNALVASALSGLLLATIHAVSQLASGTDFKYALEHRVTLHFIVNGLSVGVVAFLLTERAWARAK